MITENLSTLKINRLTQEQYDLALTNGTINANELYLTPDDNELDTSSFLRVTDVGSAVDTNPIDADTLQGKSASDFATNSDIAAINSSLSTKAPLASPSFTGTATVSANTDYTIAQLRNVIISVEEPVDGTGNNGDIWIKYKV